MCNYTFSNSHMQFIFIDKSTNLRVVVTALQIIQLRLRIIVVATISKRVDVCNMRFCFGNISTVSIGYRKHLTPSIIGISRNRCTFIIGNCNDIALQVLIEIICGAIILDSANCAVEVIKILIDVLRTIANVRNNFLNDVCTIENILMNFTACGFLNTNTFVVILVGVRTKSFKLSALFPSCRCAEVVGRVAVCIFIISYQPLFVKKNSAPQIEVRRKLIV